MDPLKILKKEIDNKSIGQVSKELGISKATVSLVAREKYPNPYKIYAKIKEFYKPCEAEIIGVEASTNSLKELLEEIG